MTTAKVHLDRAVKILRVTHGKTHSVTNKARETLTLVARALELSALGNEVQGS